jgi:hypothetical protein
MPKFCKIYFLWVWLTSLSLLDGEIASECLVLVTLIDCSAVYYHAQVMKLTTSTLHDFSPNYMRVLIVESSPSCAGCANIFSYYGRGPY